MRVGWYEAKGDFVEGRIVKRFWEGADWQWFSTVDRQMVSAVVGADDKWRGLSTNPNEPKRGTK